MKHLAFLAIAACGFPQPARLANDAATGDVAGDGAPQRRCKTWSPFTTPLLVTELVDSSNGPTEPTISDDQLDLLYVQSQLFWERRRDVETDVWGNAETPAGFGSFTPSGDAPVFLGDRLHVMFMYGTALQKSSRSGPFATFDPPTVVVDPGGAGALTPDGTVLIYEKLISQHLAFAFIQYSPETHEPIASGTLLDDSHDNSSPSIGDNGHTLVWCRDQSVIIWADLTNTAIGAIHDFDLNPGSYQDTAPSLSGDGKRMVYNSKRSTYPTPQVYVTDRTCDEYE